MNMDHALNVPEILSLIGIFLTPKDLTNCLRVCHSWNAILYPLIWHAIHLHCNVGRRQELQFGLGSTFNRDRHHRESQDSAAVAMDLSLLAAHAHRIRSLVLESFDHSLNASQEHEDQELDPEDGERRALLWSHQSLSTKVYLDTLQHGIQKLEKLVLSLKTLHDTACGLWIKALIALVHQNRATLKELVFDPQYATSFAESDLSMTEDLWAALMGKGIRMDSIPGGKLQVSVLQSLSISCSVIPIDTLDAIMEHCSQLKVLQLFFCAINKSRRAVDDGDPEVLTKYPSVISNSLQDLTLFLVRPQTWQAWTEEDDEDWLTMELGLEKMIEWRLAKLCPNLKRLSFLGEKIEPRMDRADLSRLLLPALATAIQEERLFWSELESLEVRVTRRLDGGIYQDRQDREIAGILGSMGALVAPDLYFRDPNLASTLSEPTATTHLVRPWKHLGFANTGFGVRSFEALFQGVSLNVTGGILRTLCALDVQYCPDVKSFMVQAILAHATVLESLKANVLVAHDIFYDPRIKLYYSGDGDNSERWKWRSEWACYGTLKELVLYIELGVTQDSVYTIKDKNVFERLALLTKLERIDLERKFSSRVLGPNVRIVSSRGRGGAGGIAGGGTSRGTLKHKNTGRKRAPSITTPLNWSLALGMNKLVSWSRTLKEICVPGVMSVKETKWMVKEWKALEKVSGRMCRGDWEVDMAKEIFLKSGIRVGEEV